METAKARPHPIPVPSGTTDGCPRIVIGGVTSGVGKTTVAAGIIAALRRRGLTVQPFKCGPDYIDPSHLGRAAGRPARNLDSWMLPHQAVRELFSRGCRGADVAVVEGMMGLFDGRSGEEEVASSAEIAKLLGAPVLLVMDVGKVARSAAATALGFQHFDPSLRLAGVVLNQVGSARHREMVEAPLREATGIPVVGSLPRRPDLALPERHLGLVPDAEGPMDGEKLARLAATIEESFDLDAVLRLAQSAGALAPEGTGLFPEHDHVPGGRPPVRIGVAQDRAFSFYYPENMELLQAWGAEIVPFSPLDGRGLPEGLQGLYLGGGFPEVYAGELAANEAVRQEVAAAIAAGMPVLGECGGLMYLARSLVDLEGVRHPMVGAVPAACVMERRRVGLGYLSLRTRRETPLLPAGQLVRAHEFHWSRLEEPAPPDRAAFDIEEHPGRLEGFAGRNLLASYAHLHFAARPDLAPQFVETCRRWSAGDAPHGDA